MCALSNTVHRPRRGSSVPRAGQGTPAQPIFTAQRTAAPSNQHHENHNRWQQQRRRKLRDILSRLQTATMSDLHPLFPPRDITQALEDDDAIQLRPLPCARYLTTCLSYTRHNMMYLDVYAAGQGRDTRNGGFGGRLTGVASSMKHCCQQELATPLIEGDFKSETQKSVSPLIAFVLMPVRPACSASDEPIRASSCPRAGEG